MAIRELLQAHVQNKRRYLNVRWLKRYLVIIYRQVKQRKDDLTGKRVDCLVEPKERKTFKLRRIF